MSMLKGGKLSFVVSNVPQTEGEIGTIQRYHHFIQPVYSYSKSPGGEKSSTRVHAGEYAEAPLSAIGKSFPDAFSFKLL